MEINVDQIQNIEEAKRIIKLLIEQVQQLKADYLKLASNLQIGSDNPQNSDQVNMKELAWFNFGDSESWAIFQNSQSSRKSGSKLTEGG